MRRKLIFMAALFLIGCDKGITEEVYLIPDKFIGNVIIIYNQPNGKDDSVVNHRIIYKISKTGVLRIKGHKVLQDLSRMKYYYYDDRQLRKQIPLFDTLAKGSTMIYNNRSFFYQKSLKSKEYNYSIVIVGTPDSIPPLFDPGEFEFDSDPHVAKKTK